MINLTNILKEHDIKVKTDYWPCTSNPSSEYLGESYQYTRVGNKKIFERVRNEKRFDTPTTNTDILNMLSHLIQETCEKYGVKTVFNLYVQIRELMDISKVYIGVSFHIKK